MAGVLGLMMMTVGLDELDGVGRLTFGTIQLQQGINMRPVREYAHPDNPRHTVHVYAMGEGGPHAELHVAVQPDLPVGRLR